MKELTIEEKAKAYDETLKKAQKWYDINTNEGYRNIFEDIFPELKESEDERIRKEITTFLRRAAEGFLDPTKHCETFSKWLAWLEKQGEQKPADIQSIEKRAHEVFPDDDENTPLYRQAFIDGAVDYIDCGCKNTAWSEEDEEMYEEVLTDIIYAKNDLKAKGCLELSKRAMKAFNWFNKRYKSLRPQNTWKPSDRQMRALRDVISGCSYDIEPLVELEIKLKEL